MRTTRSIHLRALRGIFAASLALAGMGCDLNAWVPEAARTLVVPAESEVTVPGRQLVGGNPLLPDDVLPRDLGPTISTQLAQSFSTEDIDGDAVASARVTAMRVTVLDPDENGQRVRDLGFLERMAFSLGTERIEAALVAQSGDGAFDDAPVTYEFLLTEVELAEMVRSGDDLEMNGDVEVTGRPTFATTLRFEVEVTVVVDLAGALN